MTEKLDRKPVYNKTRDRRVISVPCGQWVPQRRTSHTSGTNKWRDQPHFDPWEGIHGPCDFESALSTIMGPRKAEVAVEAVLPMSQRLR